LQKTKINGSNSGNLGSANLTLLSLSEKQNKTKKPDLQKKRL